MRTIFIVMSMVASLSLLGCAPAHAPSPDANPHAPGDPNAYGDADTPALALPPSQVNIFGELDGVRRGPGRPVGDQGFEQHTFPQEGYDADVAVDPTGKWIAFASTRDSVHAGIYMQRVDGTAVIKLTSDNSENAFPTFSPDGKHIAFCSTRSGVWNIYEMDVDGRNTVQITAGMNQCVHPSFSPDGTRIVYSSLGGRSNQWELWVVNLGDGEKQEIGAGLFPNWSPQRDVDRIAYQRPRDRGTRWFSLWTLDLVDGQARRITEVAVSANAAIVSPAWSPDGKRLVFATILNPNQKHTRQRGEQDIWTVSVDGTDRRRLTDGIGINLSPAWASDNRVYFISDRGGTESVWSVLPAVGGASLALKPPGKTVNPTAVGTIDNGDDDGQ